MKGAVPVVMLKEAVPTESLATLKAKIE